MAKLKNITWSKFHSDCKLLAKVIKKRWPGSSYIIGIPRGGLIPGVLVARELGWVFLTHASTYNHLKHGVYVDDIIDSGETLNNLLERTHKQPVKFAVVYAKKKFKAIPHAQLCGDEWLKFPFEGKEKQEKDGTPV